jgi:hypothetical protein
MLRAFILFHALLPHLLQNSFFCNCCKEATNFWKWEMPFTNPFFLFASGLRRLPPSESLITKLTKYQQIHNSLPSLLSHLFLGIGGAHLKPAKSLQR